MLTPSQQILEGGDLESVIVDLQRKKERMSEDKIWLYFAQMVSGIRQCHLPLTRSEENPDGRVIVHRDLKEANSKS